MDGETFVKKFGEIVEKVSKITESRYSDWVVVSDDPDCDADYGIDGKGNLIIDGNNTNLKVSELKDIRYRAKRGCIDEENGYIKLLFDKDLVIYIYFDDYYSLGDEKYGVVCNGHYVYQLSDVGQKYMKGLSWDGRFLISDQKLVRCIASNEKVVKVPEGVTEIGEYAFYNSKEIEKIVLSKSVKRIESWAFGQCGVKEIELSNVEIIESKAFGHTTIEHIVFPETVTYVGEAVFYDNIAMDSLECIENHSNVVIDENIFKGEKSDS